MVISAVYVRPQKLEEAVELMSTDTWRILAGGTDIYPSIGENELKTSFMDLTNVSSLKGITEDQFFWKINPETVSQLDKWMTTMSPEYFEK